MSSIKIIAKKSKTQAKETGSKRRLKKSIKNIPKTTHS